MCYNLKLTLSNQYQDFIDQMSDEEDLDLSKQYESDEDESEVEDSFESEENDEYTDIDDASFSE